MRTRIGSLSFIAGSLALLCLALPAFAQNSKVVTKGPIVKYPVAYSTNGPMLREIQPLLPEFSLPGEHEVPNNYVPNRRPIAKGGDQATQTQANSPKLDTPSPNLEFEGLGATDQFFCNCAPPDNDSAAGTGNQVMEFVNLFFAVYNKTGSRVFGPFPGNNFWSGLGGSCQTDNSGDPVIRFDAAAGRWVVSQFAINGSAPDFECIAVSQTSDATGAYNKYAFAYNAFPDYPKLGVWPDAYYITTNNFNIQGTAFIGADACAVDRTKMIAGQNNPGMVCFQQDINQFGELPSDLDGPTAPPSGTPNFVMEEDPTSNSTLDMFKFHVDFVTPSNSTFTGPTLITVTPFTDLCGTFFRTQCVPQPGTSQTLESLGGRLMYRLVYRNFGDHTVLLASHSVVASNNQGGIRWYELRNPETGPTVFQQGTFAPDAQWRFMPAIAMDKNQDIAVGYTRTGPNTGQFPSLVYAGRIPSDPAGTLETEQVLKAGLASQTGVGRWGDYSSLTIDPSDDCTFWFQEEYQAVTGGFNWHTALGSFNFPGCGSQGQPAVTLAPKTLSFPKTLLNTTSKPLKVKLTNSGNANLLINSIASSGDFSQTNNCPMAPTPLAPAAFCTITVTFTPTAINKRTGAITITDNAPDSPQSVPLSGVGTIVSFSPTSFNFGTVTVGTQSNPQTVTLKNNSNTVTLQMGTVTITGTAKGDYVKTADTCSAQMIAPLGTCSVSAAFKPTTTGKRPASLNLPYTNGGGSPAVVSMTGTGQ